MTASPNDSEGQGSATTDVQLLLQEVELSVVASLGLPLVMDDRTIEAQIGQPAGG